MWIGFSWIGIVLTDVSVRFTCWYSSLPHPIMHIQSNLRPGVIDGAPLIWPGCTSASRFTTVATGRFGTSSGKNRHMHKTALPRFSISFSLSQLHYNEDPHQDPASTELQTNTCNTISLFVSQQNHSTQNMNTRQHIMYILHTQHNLHPQTCTAHTHSLSILPPSNADERDLQGSGTKERVTLSSNHHMVKKPCVSLATQHSQATLTHTYDLNSSINRTLERAVHS